MIPVNELTTYDSSTTSVGIGVFIRTLTVPYLLLLPIIYMHIIMIQQAVVYSIPWGGRTYGICNIYIPRAPISIYTGVCGTPGLDVFRDRTRSLPIEHVYTYIP